ncbi:PTS fructose transporter subunit IIA [Halothiobacillus diazotrophicus]|uniref:PTS fructose transporter subunit IIA n=1 Tax=Halothiobacillus diazotrophicus TaxID=1860122 RepID=A0A191ZE59_9GAMM|nr:PTS sugar transporter subunit IIA [Halothiobacillus diazotrophicus]ANJ66152.1 PTS fructose transporter subunit IIA [Halothiobacillus diazotrophicus]
MTVGILLICHNKIGEQLLETATDMLEKIPMPAGELSVHQDDDPIDLLNRARRRIADLDEGDGVLVLTDMYGSTPSNIAHRLKDKNRVRVISGVNLPMVVRAMNYPQLNLPQMTERVATGGREGIIEGDGI